MCSARIGLILIPIVFVIIEIIIPKISHNSYTILNNYIQDNIVSVSLVSIILFLIAVIIGIVGDCIYSTLCLETRQTSWVCVGHSIVLNASYSIVILSYHKKFIQNIDRVKK